MKISEQFSGGKYFKADHIQVPITLTIESVVGLKMFEGLKPAIRFVGEGRLLVLNKTNAHIIAQCLGDETVFWPGHEIRLMAEETTFDGKSTRGIRVQWVNPLQSSQIAKRQVPQQMIATPPHSDLQPHPASKPTQPPISNEPPSAPNMEFPAEA